jgi:hypothetical protein
MPDPTRNADGTFPRDDTALRDLTIEILHLLSRAIDIFGAAATSANERIAAVDALKRDITELVGYAGEIDRKKGPKNE